VTSAVTGSQASAVPRASVLDRCSAMAFAQIRACRRRASAVGDFHQTRRSRARIAARLLEFVLDALIAGRIELSCFLGPTCIARSTPLETGRQQDGRRRATRWAACASSAVTCLTRDEGWVLVRRRAPAAAGGPTAPELRLDKEFWACSLGRPALKARTLAPQAGRMFWLTRKKFSGSYLALISASRW
jgi:hypothetical protein